MNHITHASCVRGYTPVEGSVKAKAVVSAARTAATALLLLMFGCISSPDIPIGIPNRPHLIPLTVEMQVRIPVDALDIIAVNQAVLKNHIKRLENRILIHDESL